MMKRSSGKRAAAGPTSSGVVASGSTSGSCSASGAGCLGAPAPPSLTDASLRDFLGLSDLETLTLMEGRFTPEALAALKALPHLKKLNLQVAPLTPEQLDRVKAALPGVAVEWKPLTDEEAKKLELYLKQ